MRKDRRSQSGVCSQCKRTTRLRPNGLCWGDAWKDSESTISSLYSKVALLEDASSLLTSQNQKLVEGLEQMGRGEFLPEGPCTTAQCILQSIRSQS